MPLSDEQRLVRSLSERLAELGVATTEEQAFELASAYPALEEWVHIAEEMAEQETPPLRDRGQA